MDFRYSITADEREMIYNEVWAEPVTTVPARYNLSDNGLRKHCRKYGIHFHQKAIGQGCRNLESILQETSRGLMGKSCERTVLCTT